MKLEQISIFIENRSGRLAEVTGVLAGAGISIRALSVADTADFGILRLILDQPEQARQTLKAAGFTVSTTEVIALEVPDRPGGLWGILTLLEAAAINVEYMYAFVQKATEHAVIIFRFDDPDRALTTLAQAGVQVLPGEAVYRM